MARRGAPGGPFSALSFPPWFTAALPSPRLEAAPDEVTISGVFHRHPQNICELLPPESPASMSGLGCLSISR